MKPVEPITKTLESLQKPLNPVVGGTTGTVDKALPSACVQIKDVKGVITKELALDLIDEAIEKKLTLTTVCKGDTSISTELQKWEEGMLKSLGFLNVFGKLIPQDPNEQLHKIRDEIAKEDDGAIIFKP